MVRPAGDRPSRHNWDIHIDHLDRSLACCHPSSPGRSHLVLHPHRKLYHRHPAVLFYLSLASYYTSPLKNDYANYVTASVSLLGDRRQCNHRIPRIYLHRSWENHTESPDKRLYAGIPFRHCICHHCNGADYIFYNLSWETV